jgi:hypothetical protein
MVEVVVKEAVTITEVGRLPAVKLTVAMPQVAPGHAPVTAVAPDSVATAGLFNVNVIVWPPQRLPPGSVNVAEMVEVPSV